MFDSKLFLVNIKKMSQEQLFEAIQSFDQQDAKQLFEAYIQSIDSIVDNDNATVLHVAANYNNQEIIKSFLEQYDNQSLKEPLKFSSQRKRNWLNKKDDEGFTCVHYSVFRGNLDLAMLLEQHGADIYSINKQGLTVIHIAAQGDSPVLMYYYLNKGMKISSEDSKGSTALHWACYSGQQNSAYALLAWGAEIDKQDFTYGMTPLHLAVMSGNGRIVKKLLMRGCDRNIKNYNGKLPLDLALQNQYKNITQMIIDKQGIQELFNIKTPYRKINKLTFPFYFLLILYLTNYILNLSFVLFEHFPQKGILAFVYLLIGLMIGILFVVVSKKQPGFICIQESQNDFQMLRHNHPSKVCFDCMLLKPQRSRHCQICKRCVSVYDHHCPWVANCIGSQNYLCFYLFLVAMESFMIFSIIYQILNITDFDWSDHSALEIIRLICIIYSLLCSVVFIFPLSYLLMVQSRNSLLNQTTFERYGFQSKKSPSTGRTSSITQSLKENLLHRQNSNVTLEDVNQDRSQVSRIIAATQSTPMKNCYMMCVGNANNILYQVGRIR